MLLLYIVFTAKKLSNFIFYLTQPRIGNPLAVAQQNETFAAYQRHILRSSTEYLGYRSAGRDIVV